jgi:predicted  nucleic acid-binding Zn ribbon protein
VSKEYTLSPKELRELKSQLTKAVKSGDYQRIVRVAENALEIFDQKGYPDCWADWERALSDALLKR